MPVLLKLIPRRQGQWQELVPDSGPSLRLPLHAVPAGLAAGQILDEAQWHALAERAAYFAVYDRALRLLGRREHFTRELERKLFARNRDSSLIAHVLSELQRRGYLDDARAASYVAAFITRRGAVGPALLRSELRQRGCPAELLAGLVEEYAQQQPADEAVASLLQSRKGHFQRKLDALRRKLEQKHAHNPRVLATKLRAQMSGAVLNWLAARGFSGDEVREQTERMIRELLDETADF